MGLAGVCCAHRSLSLLIMRRTFCVLSTFSLGEEVVVVAVGDMWKIGKRKVVIKTSEYIFSRFFCSATTSLLPLSAMTTMDVEQRRLALLHEWQAFYNMTPRGDSALTRRFVSGELTWPVDVVARELMATHFLYQSTLYGEYLEEYMRWMAIRLRQGHPNLSWSDTWTIVRFYGPLTLKLYMILQCGVRIPQALPP